MAVVEQASTAVDGQIIVAVIDDAITLKRYYKEAERVRLQPENPAFQAIYCTDVRIVGSQHRSDLCICRNRLSA